MAILGALGAAVVAWLAVFFWWGLYFVLNSLVAGAASREHEQQPTNTEEVKSSDDIDYSDPDNRDALLAGLQSGKIRWSRR